MKLVDELQEQCTGCGACYRRCPVSAIVMKKDKEGFVVPEIDHERCIMCGACMKACPLDKKKSSKNWSLEAYAAYHKEWSVREHSTSGGIFTAIAKNVIEKWQGIVYGVVFTDGCSGVEYRAAENMDEVKQMNGSKYLQAESGNVFLEIEKRLQNGETILFTGLPCQVEGLLGFLQKEYENLFCMDMACFGVPSPMVWQQYLKEFWSEEEIQEVVFKDKINGWKNWSVKVSASSGTVYQPRWENYYMNSFLKGINVRHSCLACQFKGIERRSDITIADCWGIGEQNRELNDDRGLSAVLIQSEKGKMLWNEIKEEIRWQQYEPQQLMEGNWAMTRCVQANRNREIFFEMLQGGKGRDAFLQYCSVERKE